MRESFDPTAVCREVVALTAPSAEAKALRLGAHFSPRVPEWIEGDPTRFRQVLLNLVSNAIKFTAAGQVAVWMDYKGGRSHGTLIVEVEDTGIGIPAAERNKLFQRFYQTDSSLSRHSGGTGLGLAISRELVERMGGTIRLESTPGRGSTFRFTVRTRPAAAPAAHAAERRRRPTRRRRDAAADPGRRGQPDQPVHRARLSRAGGARGDHRRQRRGRGRGGAAERVRRGADGRADAQDGRPDRRPGHPRPARARRRGADRRADRQRDGGRPRVLSRGGHERLLSKPIEIEALHAAIARAALRRTATELAGRVAAQ